MLSSIVVYFPALKLLKIRSPKNSWELLWTLQDFLRLLEESIRNSWRVLQELSEQGNRQLSCHLMTLFPVEYIAICVCFRIYVCGGRDGNSCLRSLESFDPHTNKWTLLAQMHKRRGALPYNIIYFQVCFCSCICYKNRFLCFFQLLGGGSIEHRDMRYCVYTEGEGGAGRQGTRSLFFLDEILRCR